MTLENRKEIHPLARLIDPQKVPNHVAIIMDGNGRWAKQRGLPRIEGHKAGIEAVKQAVEAAQEINVNFLTLYAFSVENWKRPQSEIKGLFELLEKYLDSESGRIEKEKIRFKTIGRIGDLPEKICRKLNDIENKTKDNDGLTLTLALSYGGRAEIVDAVKKIVRKVKEGEDIEIDEEVIRNNLYKPEIPDPDLLIRTSGEYRISNFLLWQIAYSEIVILDVFWPDFKKSHFLEAVLDYQRRERRYGGISEV